ncbi:NfeD family protein [Stieleria sp. TO1_6]|uniref:NfeD family protein n=1 Tax=Stieleria tagensis TaxID=2956795 RepID=UPI00209B74EC|nr:NfeD family protein [Stieleria tagensis]MCO8121181.1 NfeD family protein [Stieleria tagensis]
MTEKPILIGDVAKTIGALKPAGQIRIHGQTLNATSQGTWIDPGCDVQIVGGHSGKVIVRLAATDARPLTHQGDPLPAADVDSMTPLQSPAAWVERGNAVGWGALIGLVLIPVYWFTGTELGLSVVSVPLAGAIAGGLFRWLVASANDAVGPRVDHRPAAIGIAALVILSGLLGSAIGAGASVGFAGVSCGLLAGVVVAGVIRWMILFASLF